MPFSSLLPHCLSRAQDHLLPRSARLGSARAGQLLTLPLVTPRKAGNTGRGGESIRDNWEGRKGQVPGPHRHSCPHGLAAVTEGSGQGDRTWERSNPPPKHCSSPERGTSHFWAVVSSGLPVVIPQPSGWTQASMSPSPCLRSPGSTSFNRQDALGQRGGTWGQVWVCGKGNALGLSAATKGHSGLGWWGQTAWGCAAPPRQGGISKRPARDMSAPL